MTRLNWKYDKQYDCYVSDKGFTFRYHEPGGEEN